MKVVQKLRYSATLAPLDGAKPTRFRRSLMHNFKARALPLMVAAAGILAAFGGYFAGR
jgi:hypothetical protein